MKQFFKMVLAVVVGVIITTVIGILFSLMILGSVAAMSSATPVLPRQGVLVMDMSKMLVAEQTMESNPLSGISPSGQILPQIGVWDAVRAINKAATDPAVSYLYLKVDGSTSSLASVLELRRSLENFRAGGKAVVAYTEAPTTGGYYLASVADKVYMTPHPGATVTFTGVGSQMIFVKDLLDKFGVNVQLIRHGKYKSAGEMFIRNSASPENLEQYQAMINSLWETISSEISASRGIEVGALNSALDELKLCLPQDFVDAGLVDELLTRDQLQAKLATLAVKDNYNDVSFIPFTDYVAVNNTYVSRSREKIAVIYADGNIVDGSDERDVAGDRFATVIRKVREDDAVKAVVLRVNSPGGSVLASEKIKRELDLLGEQKPLVSSYGDYAASGGYWISNNCSKIFSDPVTLTGSIGVFGMIPDFSKTLKDVAHVNIQAVTSNKHGDMYGLTRPFDSAEAAYMQRSIEDIYDRFTTIVSEGRDIPKQTVDEIAQGRVWTGADALGIKLVDELGTLEDAIEYAALSAGNSDLAAWNIKAYPKMPTVMEQMMEMLTGTPADGEVALLKVFGDLTKAQITARLPYEIKLSY